MANKRMFALEILGSDAFVDMPFSAQMLYVDLGLRADDDGFVSRPKAIMRMTGTTIDDFNLLIAKRYIFYFPDEGLVVIRHWMVNNNIRKDSYIPTIYLSEKARLSVAENGVYELVQDFEQDRNKTSTEPVQSLVQDLEQVSDKTSTEPAREPGTQNNKNRTDKTNKRRGDEVSSADAVTATATELDAPLLAKILEAWNACECTRNIRDIPLMGARYNNTRLSVSRAGGVAELLVVIRSLDDQVFFQRRAASGDLITYDWFIQPDNLSKVAEGNYRDDFNRESQSKEDDDLTSVYKAYMEAAEAGGEAHDEE